MLSNDTQDLDVSISEEFAKRLNIIEIGALNGELDDPSHHFDNFFSIIKDFIYRAVSYSKKSKKQVDLEFLDIGIQIPKELSLESKSPKNFQ